MKPPRSGLSPTTRMRHTEPMGFHHVAMAIHDVQANYDFNTKVMGFELVNTDTAPTPEGGFSKQFF